MLEKIDFEYWSSRAAFTFAPWTMKTVWTANAYPDCSPCLLEYQDGPVLDAESRLAALRRVRKRANAQFVRVYRAYRVLSDSIKKQASSFIFLVVCICFRHC